MMMHGLANFKSRQLAYPYIQPQIPNNLILQKARCENPEALHSLSVVKVKVKVKVKV
jgi:hypothetical protein